MKKIQGVIVCAVILTSAFVLVLICRPSSAAVSEEDKYDSTQWYFKARYLYEQRKDVAAAKKAVFNACDLDFDNAEAFAYMRVMFERTKTKIPDKYKVKIPEYKGKSQSAARWFINGIEAFNRGEYSGALFCFTSGAKVDVGNDELSYMVNICKREILLRKIKEKIEGKMESDAETAGLTGKSGESKGEGTSETYLSIKTARALLESGAAGYDPDKFSEWLGFAKYIYNEKKDYKSAKVAVDAALLFYSSSEVALKLKGDVEQKIAEMNEAENKRKKEIEEAMERERKRRLEEEKNRRSTSVKEIVVGEKPDAKKNQDYNVGDDFAGEEFMEDTFAVGISGETVEVRNSMRPEITAREIVLVNDPKPTAERRKVIDEVREYVSRHTKLANEKFETGKFHESLLEYEKIYLKILELDKNDLKSLYNLVLIYMKMGEQKYAQETFIRLVGAVNETSARYSGNPAVARICDYVDCTIKTSIVNAGVVAYNRKNYYKMDRSNFDMSKLRDSGYLMIRDDEDRQIALSLVENTFVNKDDKKISYIITGLSCKRNGKYNIGNNGVVSCNLHGDNPLVLSADYDSENPENK